MGYSVSAEGQVLIRCDKEQEAVAAIRAAYRADREAGAQWGWVGHELLCFDDPAPIDEILAAAGFDDASTGETCEALNYLTVDLAHSDSMDTKAIAHALAALSPFIWPDDLDQSFVECRGEDDELWQWGWAEGDTGPEFRERTGRIVWE